jgi:hypothetical protein
MNRSRKLASLFLAVICLALGGCSQTKELGKILGALAAVRSEIIKSFGEQDVNVNVNSNPNGTTFSVTFINSPVNEQNHALRSERAQKTAEIVKANYQDIKTVNNIVVVFSRARSFLAIFHSTAIVDVFWFDRDAKPRVEAGFNESGVGSTIPEEDPLEPQVTYSAARNETEIYLGGILLDGVPAKGLTMIPRIMVKGNTNKTTPEAPESMRFDFASFADKPQFPGVTKIKFIADKNYEFEGQFSTGGSNDGTVSEFLYLQIPYADYRHIADSKAVTVVLGKKQFVLTSDQILALRKLTQHVKAAP